MALKVTSWIVNAPDRETLNIPGPGDILMKLKHGSRMYDRRVAEYYGQEFFIPVLEEVAEPSDVTMLLNESQAPAEPVVKTPKPVKSSAPPKTQKKAAFGKTNIKK